MPDDLYFLTNKEEAMRDIAKWATKHLKPGARTMVAVDRPKEGRTFTFVFHEEGEPELEVEDKIAICVNAMDAITSKREGSLHTKMRVE